MTDNTELKRLAEAANAVTSDARVEMTIASEPGPNQAEIDAVTAFMGAATPAAIAALIAENERLRADCSSMRGSLKTNAVSIKKLIKDGGRAARERDQLKAELATERQRRWDGNESAALERDEDVRKLRAEIAGLKTGYEAYERVNAELKAENEALLGALKGMTSMYGHCWDLVDGGLLCMQDNVQRFEDAHEAAQKVIAALGQGEQS